MILGPTLAGGFPGAYYQLGLAVLVRPTGLKGHPHMRPLLSVASLDIKPTEGQ